MPPDEAFSSLTCGGVVLGKHDDATENKSTAINIEQAG